MSSETCPQREILANIGISFKVRRGGRRGGGHSSAPDGESLCREVSEKRDQEQRQSRQGRRLGVSHRDLSNTRKKKNHPSLHGQRRRHGDSFELQRSVTHMGEGGRWGGGRVQEEGGEGWVSTYSTVYSECIVKCVCRQVLLNYIFVCKTETDVSFFYGGTTGSEQRHLEMMSNCLSI